jgi:hypothetical protein
LGNRLLNVVRKLRVVYDIVVECFLQKFCAIIPSVTVEYAKNLNFRPVLSSCNFLGRLNDIQNNGDPVLVALSHSAHVGVCCECTHATKGLVACLGVLEKGQIGVDLGLIFLD